MSFVFSFLMFSIVIPLGVVGGRFFYRFWIRTPHLLRYLLFLPIAVLIGGIVGNVLLTLAFRDLIFTNEETFWVTHIIPMLRPAFTFPAMALLVLWLCPGHEKRVTQGFLVTLVAIICSAWLFSVFASFYGGIPFWYETTSAELGQTVVALAAVILIWKNLDALNNYKAKSQEA